MRKKRKQKTATTRKHAFLTIYTTALVCLTLYLFATPVQAQPQKSTDYALIFGTVWGPDDRPLYGVTIKIRRAGDKKAKWEAVSNHLGEFEQRVPVGKQDYVIWADLRGYKNPEYKHLQAGSEVTVHIESDERVDTGVHLK